MTSNTLPSNCSEFLYQRSEEPTKFLRSVYEISAFISMLKENKRVMNDLHDATE